MRSPATFRAKTGTSCRAPMRPPSPGHTGTPGPRRTLDIGPDKNSREENHRYMRRRRRTNRLQADECLVYRCPLSRSDFAFCGRHFLVLTCQFQVQHQAPGPRRTSRKQRRESLPDGFSNALCCGNSLSSAAIRSLAHCATTWRPGRKVPPASAEARKLESPDWETFFEIDSGAPGGTRASHRALVDEIPARSDLSWIDECTR
jgi:hypothetical protein